MEKRLKSFYRDIWLNLSTGRAIPFKAKHAFKKSYSFEQTRRYCFVEIQQSHEMLLNIHDKMSPK